MMCEKLAKRYSGPLQSEEPCMTPNHVCLSKTGSPEGDDPMIGRYSPDTRLCKYIQNQ